MSDKREPEFCRDCDRLECQLPGECFRREPPLTIFLKTWHDDEDTERPRNERSACRSTPDTCRRCVR